MMRSRFKHLLRIREQEEERGIPMEHSSANIKLIVLMGGGQDWVGGAGLSKKSCDVESLSFGSIILL